MNGITRSVQQADETLSELGLTVRPFDIEQASEDEWRAFHALSQRLRAEFSPDDPPFPLEQLRQNLQTIPDFVDYRLWLVWRSVYESEAEAVANLYTRFAHGETNQNLMDVGLYVADEWRRKGIARALLPIAVAQGQRHGRDSWVLETYEHVPAGEQFMQRLDAQRGITFRTSQVATADIDRDLLCAWQERVDGEGLEFGLWDSAYPEAELERIAALKEAMNTQPLEDLEVEDEKITPERLRQIDEMIAVRGHQRWTTWVRDAKTGEYAGYSDVYWQPGQPRLGYQGDTAVVPKYRRRGLGRWLKARMAEQVVADKPEIELIRTGNAKSNAGMLKINHEMGFRDYKVQVVWQLPLAKVEAYLA